MTFDDIKDLADAIEKVVYNLRELRESNSIESTDSIFDPLKAIEDHVKQ